MAVPRLQNPTSSFLNTFYGKIPETGKKSTSLFTVVIAVTQMNDASCCSSLANYVATQNGPGRTRSKARALSSRAIPRAAVSLPRLRKLVDTREQVVKHLRRLTG